MYVLFKHCVVIFDRNRKSNNRFTNLNKQYNTTSTQLSLKRKIPQVNSLQKRSSQSIILFLSPWQRLLIHGGDIDFNLMEHLYSAVSGVSCLQPEKTVFKSGITTGSKIKGET